jgi:aspartyl-tRNA(Asn)/glutamyl-tRNA(Gln) amidotransferase subunit C
MKLTLEQVRHVAMLARLALTPEEETRCQVQLSAILDAVDQLNALDTSQVEPTTQMESIVQGALPPSLRAQPGLREDVVQPSLGAEAAVANAPARSGTRFAVPRVLE